MRILLANPTAYPHIGGVENSLRYIGAELLERGHEVRLFCFQFSPVEPRVGSIEGILIHRCPRTMSRWPHKRLYDQVDRTRDGIQTLLKEFHPDEIWCRSAAMGLGISESGFGGRLVQIFSTSAGMDSRGTFLQTFGIPWSRRLAMAALYPLAYTAMRRIERTLLARCQPVVFSENMRLQLRREYGALAERTRVIPAGVDTRNFSPASAAQCFAEISETYGLSGEEGYILYVGRLSPAKNLPLLFRSMTLLKDRERRLVLVGEGREEARLRALAARLGLGRRILFVGKQTNLLPGFYGSAGVSVLPTTLESFGQVYLESMACGTPVVGFGGGGATLRTATAEIVTDGVTGRVVPVVSPDALAEAIEDVLRLPPDRYREMSSRCIEDARTRFSWKRFVESLLVAA